MEEHTMAPSDKHVGTRRSETALPDGDYHAIDGRAWLRIDRFAVRAHRTCDGIRIDICADGDEFDEIASVSATVSDLATRRGRD